MSTDAVADHTAGPESAGPESAGLESAGPEPAGPGPAGESPQERGLRGVFAATLTMEAMVVWMAIAPLGVTVGVAPAALVLLGVLGLSLVLLAGMLRRPWALRAGTFLQVVVVSTGFVHPAMFVLGGVFLVLWLVLLRMRVRLLAGTLPKPPTLT